MIGLGDASRLDLTLAAGRLPAGDGEVALGRDTAAAHGVHVGDHVELSGDGIETRQATVTGLTVMPALGPFESDRASPGSGMVLPAAMFDADTINAMASFVGVHVADGARPAAVLTALRTDYPAWHADSFTVDHLDPVRPAEIIDAQDMRSIPLLVGGLLAVTVVVGLCLVVVASVRARRRELGILRSLGFTGRQVGRSVRVQAAATMLAAVAIGAPLGIVVGRVTWRSFASRLAVVEPPATATLAIAVTVVGAVLAAVVVASIPAAMAARTRPTKILHSE
jgi:putative ABC transport system permease protein